MRGIRGETELFLQELARISGCWFIRGARFRITKRTRILNHHHQQDAERWAVYLELPDLDVRVRLRMYRLMIQRWNWFISGYGSFDVPLKLEFPERFRGRRFYFTTSKRPPSTTLQRKFYDISYLGNGQKPPHRRDDDGIWLLP